MTEPLSRPILSRHYVVARSIYGYLPGYYNPDSVSGVKRTIGEATAFETAEQAREHARIASARHGGGFNAYLVETKTTLA